LYFLGFTRILVENSILSGVVGKFLFLFITYKKIKTFNTICNSLYIRNHRKYIIRAWDQSIPWGRTWKFPGISYFTDLRPTRSVIKISKTVLKTRLKVYISFQIWDPECSQKFIYFTNFRSVYWCVIHFNLPFFQKEQIFQIQILFKNNIQRKKLSWLYP
jgi:hypothetical protein